jgi:hypothetical protein
VSERDELLARVVELADNAQVAAGELEGLRAELASARRVNAELRALIATGKLANPPAAGALPTAEMSELMLDQAAALVGRERQTALVLTALVNGCLIAAHPRAAMDLSIEVLQRAIRAADHLAARRPTGAPS